MALPVENEHVDCPVCGKTEQIFLLKKNGWNISQCMSCSLAMVNPRAKNSLDIYTNDDYFQDEKYYYDYAGNKTAYQKGFRSKLKLISKYCPGKGNLLDVGAAYGFFMEEAGKFGFTPYGVELSESAAKQASHYGQVFHATLSDALIDKRFSAVTFIDSLEHFEQPLDGLRRAWQLLESQGIVAVMVPNIDSLFARITGDKWHLLLPEEHLYYFTPKSTRLMLEKAEFQVLHMGTGGYGRSLAEVLRVLFRNHGLALGALEKHLRKITFEINLGDIFAIAKKTE
jgi:2-polyprenyl-3-methyl-5-hydroxy-6-metoxy-1,4-benzoquinol methylase